MKLCVGSFRYVDYAIFTVPRKWIRPSNLSLYKTLVYIERISVKTDEIILNLKALSWMSIKNIRLNGGRGAK